MCRVALGQTLQARVQEECCEKLQRSATDKSESAVLALASVEVRFVSNRSQRKLGIRAKKIGRCRSEGCGRKVRENIFSGDLGTESR